MRFIRSKEAFPRRHRLAVRPDDWSRRCQSRIRFELTNLASEFVADFDHAARVSRDDETERARAESLARLGKTRIERVV